MFGLPALPRTADAALRDVEHPNARVRLSALADLVRHTSTDARERVTLAIIALLRSDPDAELRAAAAMALADAEATGGRAALLAALDDPMLRVRQMALLALGELGEPGDGALEAALTEALSSPEAALRFQALVASDRLLPERAATVLEAALGDNDDEVRAMALRLARRRWPGGDDGPPALLELARRALDDAAAVVRAGAALWLAPRREPRAEEVLVSVVTGSVPIATGPDLEEAIELVGELGLVSARPGLERRAFGVLRRINPLAWHARVALAKLGDERARHAILKDLDAWSRDARTLAVVAAGRAGMREASARIRAFRGDAGRAAPEAVEEALAELGE